MEGRLGETSCLNAEGRACHLNLVLPPSAHSIVHKPHSNENRASSPRKVTLAKTVYEPSLKTFNALSLSTACLVASRMGSSRNSFLNLVRPRPLVAHMAFLLPALSRKDTRRGSRAEGIYAPMFP